MKNVLLATVLLATAACSTPEKAADNRTDITDVITFVEPEVKSWCLSKSGLDIYRHAEVNNDAMYYKVPYTNEKYNQVLEWKVYIWNELGFFIANSYLPNTTWNGLEVKSLTVSGWIGSNYDFLGIVVQGTPEEIKAKLKEQKVILPQRVSIISNETNGTQTKIGCQLEDETF